VELRDLLFRFQQQAHHYIRHLPLRDDLSSWFELMQHHGVPTPFLDWTHSSYVAMYFALEEEPRSKEKCSAVWAIDLDWLEIRGCELLKSGSATLASNNPNAKAEQINGLLAQNLLGEGEDAVIIKICPMNTNERMAAQQGVSLCGLFHKASFSRILMRMMIRPETPDRPVVRKLELGINYRVEFLKTLRAMNIHRASLFPGLDGFGQSLRLDLELKDRDTAV
jgi:hypothetical protein